VVRAAVHADLAEAQVAATAVLADIVAAAALDLAAVAAVSTVVVVGSAAAVVVDSMAAVVVADTTNRTSAVIQNFNNSLLNAGCCCFVA
jgi:hypothetical protein